MSGFILLVSKMTRSFDAKFVATVFQKVWKSEGFEMMEL